MTESIIALLSTVFGAISGFFAYKLKEKGQNKQKAPEVSELSTSLSYIKERIEELISEQRDISSAINEINIKIARDEEIQKSGQKRLDTIEKHLTNYKSA